MATSPGLILVVQRLLTVCSTRRNLREALLLQTKIKGTSFVDAGLLGAVLVEAELRDVDMRGADLSSANLRRTIFHDVILESAILDFADLTGVVFSGTTQVDLKWRIVKNIYDYGGKKYSLAGHDFSNVNY